MEFKVGDIVQLKSGGPIMTVTNSAHDMQGTVCVACVWYIGASGNEIKNVFPATALKAIISEQQIQSDKSGAINPE
jgi:uncharacterized protein YodC (DUF2158 family)